MKIVVLFFCALVALGCSTRVRYDNYQVYRITPRTEEHLSALKKLENNPAFNLWTDVTYVNRSVDVMVSPLHKNYLNKYLRNIEHYLWIEDVQKLIDNEGINNTKIQTRFDWISYQSLNAIHYWLEKLSKDRPNQVTLIQGGVSYENRTILGVKVSFKPGNKAVFLEGGIHAREWISTATVTFILNEVLTSTDPEVRKLVEMFDWYVFPAVNPDGYEFSRVTNRLWRKTRKPHPNGCIGADPNRNWGYMWMHGGASSYPCSDTYAGTNAFSEIETQSLSEFITSINEDLVAYIGFHSFSQLLMIPFGHDGNEVPENNAELHDIGYKAAAALAKRYGTQYKVGNIPEVIYVGSGGSSDWVKGTFKNVRFVYTFELRDTGRYGFLLPPQQIIPTGEETFDAIKSMLCDIINII